MSLGEDDKNQVLVLSPNPYTDISKMGAGVLGPQVAGEAE